MKTVILANGSFPTHEIPLSHLRKADLIVCCDGASGKLALHGLEPGAIVGDLDSITPEVRDKYRHILFGDNDQETNDLTKAVKWCLAGKITEVVIVGATGMREDHTLGNISLLAEYKKEMEVIMLTDTGSFTVYDHSVTISSFPGQQVSLFSIDPALAVTSSGLRYPLTGLRLSSWWRGTLNEAEGESFTLTFEKGSIIVYQKYRD